jgi:hypothetical protein
MDLILRQLAEKRKTRTLNGVGLGAWGWNEQELALLVFVARTTYQHQLRPSLLPAMPPDGFNNSAGDLPTSRLNAEIT